MDKTVLVNRNNPVNNKIIDNLDLIDIKSIEDTIIKIDKETYNAFLKLQEFCKTKNLEIGIESAYRSLEEQQTVTEYYLESKGKEYVDKYVAPVGCSEHHTGLAIDFYIKEEEYPEDDTEIRNDTKYKEVHKYLKDFGFILRYPKEKEDITGYSYEPWHIRYVGNIVANICYENDLTLEEYKTSYSGVIVINKEKGMTSFDVVNNISKTLGIKKVGHTGTLDPLAEGVLIICIGQATKIVELLTAHDKEYIAGVKLGIKTDTLDIEGEVLEEKEVPNNLPIEETLNSFKKTYLQEVPIFSAVKVNGKKLYEYARNNIKVELPKKEVTIKEIELLEKNNGTFIFKTLVTKGCYIRSLINDIGISLGTNAIMTSLIRTKQGNVSIEEAYTLEDFNNNNFKIYKIEEILPYERIIVDRELEFKIKNGMKINNNWNIKDKVMFINENNKLLGIYEVEHNHLRVWKNFN